MSKLKEVLMLGRTVTKTVTVKAASDKEAIIKANKKNGWAHAGDAKSGPWHGYIVKTKKRWSF